MNDIDLDELRSELDDFADAEKKGGRSPREERIIAGFEEIQRFLEKHGRTPQHGEDRDIFERLYAVRLDRLRGLEECRSLLAPLDNQGLLSGLKQAEDAITHSSGYIRASLSGRVPTETERNFRPTMRLTISSMFVSPMSRSAALRPS